MTSFNLSKQPPNVCVIPILHTRKMQHREVKQGAKSHPYLAELGFRLRSARTQGKATGEGLLEEGVHKLAMIRWGNSFWCV